MTTKVFATILTSDQEVPTNASTAIGLGVVLWDTASDTAAYRILAKGVDFGEAVGTGARTAFEGDDVTNMHVHNQARGVNGAVVFGQFGPAHDTDDLRIKENADGSWAIAGKWEPSDPASTSILSFAAALDAADPGSDVPLYFNIHTDDFPAGEIRGQWVTLATVENDGGRPEVSLDADTARGLFEAFLRFLSRDSRSNRDPSHDGADDHNLLAAIAGLTGVDADPLEHLLGHGNHGMGAFGAEHSLVA
jgi:hypothetical protein